MLVISGWQNEICSCREVAAAVIEAWAQHIMCMHVYVCIMQIVEIYTNLPSPKLDFSCPKRWITFLSQSWIIFLSQSWTTFPSQSWIIYQPPCWIIFPIPWGAWNSQNRQISLFHADRPSRNAKKWHADLIDFKEHVLCLSFCPKVG